MKYTHHLRRLGLVSFLAAGSVNAATIVQSDPQAGGIGYAWTVQIGNNQSIATTNSPNASVGVWSWEDTAFAGAPNMGWTHTTSWVALEVTEATTLTIVMGQNSSIPYLDGFREVNNLFPSFTIWNGWDNSGTDSHIYSNTGLIDWAEELTGVAGFVDNSTDHTAELTLTLEPGLYSIALGSQGPATGGLPRQGYFATFTTVPEPSSALLAVGAAGIFGLRRRRH